VAAVPKYRLAEEGLPADVVAQAIRDERSLDANPRLNLATFLTTWMEPQARELMADALAVNAVELEEYGSVTEMTTRCVAILSRLFHLPDDVTPAGAATVGSTEALMLSLLALKAQWQRRRREAGLSVDAPNLVLGHEAQVALEKFCRYFEVHPRFVELSEECLVATPAGAAALVDERTIGVVAVLGSTYTGEFEDVAALCEQLAALNARTGWDVRVHVDAASGGFVAPFTQPDLAWDFRQPLVASINTSGHKFGLVYPGIGWTLFRDVSMVPSDLVLHTHYLGGDQPNFNLNFSKPAAPIIGQYYMLLRLGRSGYATVMARLMETKRQLEEAILQTGHFRLLSPRGAGVPLVAATLRRGSATDPDAPAERLYDEFEVSDRLRMHGWTVPAYRMAPRAQRIMLLRMVVREDLSPDMAQALGRHLAEAVDYLDARTAHMHQEDAKCVRSRGGMRTFASCSCSHPRAGTSTSSTRPSMRRTACRTTRCAQAAEHAAPALDAPGRYTARVNFGGL
jgi:glutamate decarboxylase